MTHATADDIARIRARIAQGEHHLGCIKRGMRHVRRPGGEDVTERVAKELKRRNEADARLLARLAG